MTYEQLTIDDYPPAPTPSFSAQVVAQNAVECPPKPSYKPPKGKMAKLLQVMQTGQWHSPLDLCPLTGISPLCITSRIRDLRKEEYGGHNVKWNENPTNPLYRLVPPESPAPSA